MSVQIDKYSVYMLCIQYFEAADYYCKINGITNKGGGKASLTFLSVNF